MRIGLDYRAAAGYPISGIGRQNLALETGVSRAAGRSTATVRRGAL